MITAKIIANSIYNKKQITTFELEYPRYIHAELMTHRVFSRNAASSRAIPIQSMIDLVKNETVMPIWTKNQAGMQGERFKDIESISKLNRIWMNSAQSAILTAAELEKAGAHKQNANRVLEPYQHIKVIVTATDFSNWFKLRYHKDAQGEIAELAKAMAAEFYTTEPKELTKTGWHLPYVDESVMTACREYALKANRIAGEIVLVPIDVAKQVSASCCAQVSYRKLDESIEKAVNIYSRLVGGEPIHASPFEHQATPCKVGTEKGNFTGWRQFRRDIESKS